MVRLDLVLLGGFRARLVPGGPMALPARKAQALLAYLARASGEAQPRDKLAALLWGDMRHAQARASLRQVLTTLRRALADCAALRADGEAIALDPSAVSVDATAFERG